jgi:hypothetical protein
LSTIAPLTFSLVSSWNKEGNMERTWIQTVTLS